MYTFFYTLLHKYEGVGGGGGIKDTSNWISYATYWNKRKDYHAFMLSFDFKLHSQHLAAISIGKSSIVEEQILCFIFVL
jgi:hypothetical protein